MKKSDLRTGMWVEYRTGEKRMVALAVKDYGNIIAGNGGWNALDSYSDDLINEDTEKCDIVKIYDIDYIGNINEIPTRKPIWEREPEPIEMTLEEACKKLRETVGKPVKIIL